VLLVRLVLLVHGSFFQMQMAYAGRYLLLLVVVLLFVLVLLVMTAVIPPLHFQLCRCFLKLCEMMIHDQTRF
jgi:hypothetical protein